MNTENTQDVTPETTPQEQFDQFVSDNKICFKFNFVPFSMSRNANDEHKSLNWTVKITKGKDSIITDYMKGVGHLDYPQHFRGKSLSGNDKHLINNAIETAVETGVAHNVQVGSLAGYLLQKKKFPNPTLQEVLQSLVSECDVRNYSNFEDWAGNFGYEKDSIKALKVYQECQKTATQLVKMLGEDGITKVGEILREIDEQPTPPKKNKM
jgi:hypothetical protein